MRWCHGANGRLRRHRSVLISDYRVKRLLMLMRVGGSCLWRERRNGLRIFCQRSGELGVSKGIALVRLMLRLSRCTNRLRLNWGRIQVLKIGWLVLSKLCKADVVVKVAVA